MLKPRLFVCQICGREYGSASLAIHMKTCIVKFENEQLVLPPSQRRALQLRDVSDIIGIAKGARSDGSSPSSLGSLKHAEVDAFNDVSFQQFSQALSPCELCGRRFLPDRLLVHQRSCRPGNESQSPLRMKQSSPESLPAPSAVSSSSSLSSSSAALASSRLRPAASSPAPRPSISVAARPRTWVCYLCSREFGSASILIHERSCLERFHREQSQLAAGVRRPLPLRPDYESFLASASASSASPSPDSPSSAFPSSPSRPMSSAVSSRAFSRGVSAREVCNAEALASAAQTLLPCDRCGRTFLPDRLPVHLRGCKVEMREARVTPVAARVTAQAAPPQVAARASAVRKK